MTSTSFKQNTGLDEFKGITCEKCGGPVLNYDPGSAAYKAHYGHTLPAICDNCLNNIFMNVRRHGRGD